ncbi:YidB family protein [soil metagenome]
MGLLDSLLETLGGSKQGESNPLVGAIGGMISQQGGVQGLMNQFSEKGLGDAFSSWVGLGENHAISADQIQNVLGHEQVAALAQKIGIDPAQASAMLSQYLPKIIDKLTPSGQVDANHDVEGGLASLLKDGIGKFLG